MFMFVSWKKNHNIFVFTVFIRGYLSSSDYCFLVIGYYLVIVSWNLKDMVMFPVLFEWSSFSLYTYGAFVAVGFFLGFQWILHTGKRSGLSQDVIGDFVWVALIFGLIGARILYVLFNWDYYWTRPIDIFKIWQGGLVWYGGLIVGAAAGAWLFRKKSVPLGLAADVCAPGLALAHAIGRIGCFFAGCCYGKPCDLPWAIMFTHSQTLAPAQVSLHPTQIYEAFLNFLLFGVLVLIPMSKRPGSGKLALLYLGLFSVIRLGIEFLRGDDRGPVFLYLTFTQWISISGLFLAAGIWFVLIKRGSEN